MTEVDTQPVISGEQFLPGSNPAPAPAPAVVETPQAQDANKAPQQSDSPKAVEQTTVADIDPLEAAIEQSLSPQEEPKWSDDAKSVFKHYFGSDDPVAYKSEQAERAQRMAMLEEEYNQLSPLKKSFDSLTPPLQRAFQLAMEGKQEEAQRFLQTLPEDVFMGREAKNINSEKLIETYLPGKISADDWAALKDPDTDPDVKKAIEFKVKTYRDVASEMHENKRNEISASIEEKSKSEQARQKAYSDSIVSSLASAEADPVLKTFITPEVRRSLSDGTFLKPFLLDDGSALSKDAVTNYLWAIHGKSIAKAQFNVGYKRGKNEGSLEVSQLQPGAPPKTRDGSGAIPPDNSVDAVKERILSRIQG